MDTLQELLHPKPVSDEGFRRESVYNNSKRSECTFNQGFLENMMEEILNQARTDGLYPADLLSRVKLLKILV